MSSCLTPLESMGVTENIDPTVPVVSSVSQTGRIPLLSTRLSSMDATSHPPMISSWKPRLIEERKERYKKGDSFLTEGS